MLPAVPTSMPQTRATIAVLTVPFESHAQTIAEIKNAVRGKIVVDATVPLVPPKVSTVQLPTAGSAAQIAQRLLGEDVRVVSAFHMSVPRSFIRAAGSIAMCWSSATTKRRATSSSILLGSWHAEVSPGGSLANSAAAEAMTSVLIWINRQYKVPGAGIGITALEIAGPT